MSAKDEFPKLECAAGRHTIFTLAAALRTQACFVLQNVYASFLPELTYQGHIFFCYTDLHPFIGGNSSRNLSDQMLLIRSADSLATQSKSVDMHPERWKPTGCGFRCRMDRGYLLPINAEYENGTLVADMFVMMDVSEKPP